MKRTLDNFKLKYFFRDTCTALVTVRGGVVTCERYTDDPLNLPFGKMPDRTITKKRLILFFSGGVLKSRMLTKRANGYRILLKKYRKAGIL